MSYCLKIFSQIQYLVFLFCQQFPLLCRLLNLIRSHFTYFCFCFILGDRAKKKYCCNLRVFCLCFGCFTVLVHWISFLWQLHFKFIILLSECLIFHIYIYIYFLLDAQSLNSLKLQIRVFIFFICFMNYVFYPGSVLVFDSLLLLFLFLAILFHNNRKFHN